MTAKRALDFGQTPRKKAKYSRAVSVYRMSKPEMKAADFTLTHTAVSASNTNISSIAQGTDVFNRIGNKIKIWRIEGLVRADVPVRIQILAPNDATVAPGNGSNNLYNYRTDRLLAEYVLDAQVLNTYRHFSYKLPFGQNVVYNGSAGTAIVKGSIYIRVLAATSTGCQGEFRIYYTDN